MKILRSFLLVLILSTSFAFAESENSEVGQEIQSLQNLSEEQLRQMPTDEAIKYLDDKLVKIDDLLDDLETAEEVQVDGKVRYRLKNMQNWLTGFSTAVSGVVAGTCSAGFLASLMEIRGPCCYWKIPFVAAFGGVAAAGWIATYMSHAWHRKNKPAGKPEKELLMQPEARKNLQETLRLFRVKLNTLKISIQEKA